MNSEDRRHIPRFQNECLLKLFAPYKYLRCLRKGSPRSRQGQNGSKYRGLAQLPKIDQINIFSISPLNAHHSISMGIYFCRIIMAQHSECSSLFTDSIMTVLRLLEELKAWRRQWNQDNRDPYFETLPSDSHIIRPTSIWTTVLYFFNFSASNTNMLYNTTLVILLGILRSLRSLGSANCSFDFGIRDATIEICRCVEYSFSNH